MEEFVCFPLILKWKILLLNADGFTQAGLTNLAAPWFEWFELSRVQRVIKLNFF